MDLSDLFGGLADIGSERGGWKSGWAIAGLVLGAGLGLWLGSSGGVLSALGAGAVGGFLGWFSFLALKGVFRIALMTLLFFVVIMGWYWMTGQL